MLVLPIINKHRVMNVEVRLKNVTKVRQGIYYEDAEESEIIVNQQKFSDSSFQNTKDENAPTDFIRSKSILYPRSFFITTKKADKSDLYDVYELEQPPKKVHESLDKLYGKVITDLRKEIPGRKDRGRYISLEELGIDSLLTEEKILKLKRIMEKEKDSEQMLVELQDHKLDQLYFLLDFLKHFEFTVIPNSTISEESIQETCKSLKVLNSRDYRNLKKYYDMAQTNADIYTKISYIYKIIYKQPFHLIQSKSYREKQLIKKKEETEDGEIS